MATKKKSTTESAIKPKNTIEVALLRGLSALLIEQCQNLDLIK